VLVVEDDAQVRGVVERALRGAGYQVLAAASGAEALARVQGRPGPPQVVVTDIVMPGMDGPSLARELRRQAPAIAVLFVSGYSEEAIQRHGVLLEGAALLSKPFTTQALLAMVRAALDGG
jgi:CheY-like chemotaxis protein